MMIMEAYLPQCLPIELNNDQHIKLLRRVVEVTRILERLRQKLEESPSRGDLFSLFSYFESVQSTKIEGTKTTFDELAEYEMTKKKTLDLIETSNYNDAINHGVKVVMDKNLISLDLICELHKIVLNDSRGANKNPGCFRKSQNWIGDTKNINSISYVPPIADEVPKLMDNFESFINSNKDFDPLIAAGIMHAQFETIHPFSDGNGRVGRLLIPLYFLKNRVCGHEIIFISDELERSKYKYYTLLNGLRSDSPQWFDWLTFFLDSVEKQALKYLEKLKCVSDTIEKYLGDNKIQTSAVAQKILFFCVSYPICNSAKIAEELQVGLNTVNRWLKYFVEINMLYTDSKQRHKIYRFYEILDCIR